jgi:hypothetical protein
MRHKWVKTTDYTGEVSPFLECENCKMQKMSGPGGEGTLYRIWKFEQYSAWYWRSKGERVPRCEVKT